MTGFARVDGAGNGATWAWEARSVNGRGLDVRLRLPPGFDALEAPIREAAMKRFARGNVSITLSLERQSGVGAVRLNEPLLLDLIRAADRAAELVGGSRPDAASLLAIKGVLELTDAPIESPAERAARDTELLIGLAASLDGLQAARRSEGDRLFAILSDQVGQIESLVRSVRVSPSRTPEAIRARIKELMMRVLEAGDGFDPSRLDQEAVLVATRADVEEELARLDAHIEAAREILGQAANNGGVGRKLDFLAQEFNREANTLCSKANAVDVTRSGLALKTVIDQFREQVQNVE
ncbi:MAG: YicC/YloC family endoribonuclease [Hyphomicrobium sp.]